MKLKPFITLLLAIMFTVVSNCLFAQTTETNYFIPTPFPKSPNSAEFAKYGDYKVNLFTGLPDISIPLYTIQAGGLEVPITLSYHASGIKVAQIATWVGLGWSVSAGGTINRSIMGLPDDQTGGLFSGSFRSNVGVQADADVYYLDGVIKGQIDTRPDIFSYDFPGHSGKFFFDPTNGLKPALVPFAPIQIFRNPGFTIKDEHGNNYSFGRTTNTQESTTTTTPSHTGGAISAWMLESMISANKADTISFAYLNHTMTSPDQTTNMDILSSDVITTCTGSTPYTSLYTARNSSYVDVSVGEQDPNTITFKNGMVTFTLDSLARTDMPSAPQKGLRYINVYNFNYSTKTYQLLKRIEFCKSYFTNSTQPRLRLDSILIRDAAGGVIQHYRFDYNTSIAMPIYDSPGIDYWGYYNGKDLSDNRVPRQVITYVPNSGSSATTITIGSSTTFNNRDPDSTKMQACMLTGIHYPTGGYTTFSYQTNIYPDGTGAPTLAGGLRVTQIKSYDGTNPTPIIKTYEYHNAKQNFLLDNTYFAFQEAHYYWTNGINTGGYCAQENVTYYVSNPRLDLDPYDGAPVVYPSVTEYIGTPGTNIGKTEYLFRFTSDFNQPAHITGIPIIASAFYQRGQMMLKKEYRINSNGTYQVVKKDTSAYTAFPTNPHANVGLNVGKLKINDGIESGPVVASQGSFYSSPNNFNGYYPGYYGIPSDDNYLTGTITYIYDTNDSTKYTTSNVAYTYTDTTHQQVRSTHHMDSQGNTHVTYNKYPFDYLSGSTTHNAVVDSMLNHNMVAEVIEKWDSVKNVTTSLNAVTGGQFNQYTNGNITGSLVPLKISILKTTPPLTDFAAATINASTGVWQPDSRYVQMISFDSYDAKNNIAQYTPRNSTPVSIVWDYRNGMPIAQVKNAVNNGSSKNIAYTSFEADGQGNWSFTGAPQPDATAPEGLNSYNLSSGSISSPAIANTKGYIVSYWSNNGAANVNSTTGVALRSYNGWTYYEHTIPSGTSAVGISGTTTIDALRLYPVDAQMTTYTYDPTGLTAMADVRGQISHFEYDPFQRLKNIKDINGNIVNNYGYHTYDMTVTNDAIGATTFTRNNCPAGFSGTTTTYSVPAGRYVSSTKASANAEAHYDLNTNGQILANTVCSCSPTLINVTLVNNSGLAGFQAHFTGPNNYNFNFLTSGSTVVQVAAGSTYSLQIPGVSPFANHTFTLGTRTPVVAPSATWTSVNINTGSSDLTVTVQ